METSSMIALSRQDVLRRKMEVVANNIANMNTTGFKGEKIMFVDHLVRSRGGEHVLPEKLAFVRDVATVRDLSEGPLEKTDNPLDLAVHGDGYFSVETPDGERYTRAGRFMLDNTGRLVTQHGHPVLGEGGAPITVPAGDTKVTVARDGTVSTETAVLGRLAVVRFENPNQLRETEGGLYTSDQTAIPVETADVVQGMLEGSNVEPIIEMTRMMEVNRQYQAVKTFIEKEDDRIKRMTQIYGASR